MDHLLYRIIGKIISVLHKDWQFEDESKSGKKEEFYILCVSLKVVSCWKFEFIIGEFIVGE